jgi:broad specificity phosphatase PhoE
MPIILVRHGKPRDVGRTSISGKEIGGWLRAYAETGITTKVAPPAAVRDLASSARFVVASDIQRALESAAWLAEKDIHVDPDLREAALPESLGVSLRLPPGMWIVLARVAWWVNWAESEETIAGARQRAVRVADVLTARATEYGSVMAVGHGMFNRFVANQLRHRGWRGPRTFPSGYWGAALFDEPRRTV